MEGVKRKSQLMSCDAEMKMDMKITILILDPQ